ncbi:hypothetical protein [Lentilactobacillus sp. SPB1-3]|uniref:Uncharacterized protein n=1 Tax=Lentilactobacillus terminaliae TaxID=3003483 RepID=A0ACD5DDU2_9LACO|nr:hypothetical protein [Lentilactobacillus sp. SPB1-3]MCZ0977456.1 hypothetical protein [Lentilactobacillus sp. SPB1-3]
MKKVILWGTVILGMFGTLFFVEPIANAATWHNGVPTFLKSGFWMKTKSKDFYIKFSNRAIYYGVKDDYAVGVPLDSTVLTNPRYKKTGKSFVIDNKVSKQQNIRTTIRKISKNKATFYFGEKSVPSKNIHIVRISKLP